MLSPDITATEKQCIRALASLYAKGEIEVHEPFAALFNEGFHPPNEGFWALMKMMQGCGVLDKLTSDHQTGAVHYFVISHRAILAERELNRLEAQAKQPRDIVEDIKESARS